MKASEKFSSKIDVFSFVFFTGMEQIFESGVAQQDEARRGRGM